VEIKIYSLWFQFCKGWSIFSIFYVEKRSDILWGTVILNNSLYKYSISTPFQCNCAQVAVELHSIQSKIVVYESSWSWPLFSITLVSLNFFRWMTVEVFCSIVSIIDIRLADIKFQCYLQNGRHIGSPGYVNNTLYCLSFWQVFSTRV